MTKRKTLFLIDAANVIFRAYHAIGPMSNTSGLSTGALYGFIRTLLKLIETLKPDYISCVFDGPDNKKSRKDLYEHYKSHRTKMPDDLFTQIELALDFCTYKGIATYMVPGVEADDTIGSIASWAAQENLQVYICSGDKDLCQLVTDHIQVVHLHKDNLIVDKHKVEEIYGVQPTQIVDLLALMGDTSDNIPGVASVGPKTASQWIKTYGSIDGLYKHLNELPASKRELLENNKDIVEMSQKLAQINIEVPFTKDIETFALQTENVAKLKELYQEMQFYSLLKQMPAKTQPKTLYKIIDTHEQLEELMKNLSQIKEHILAIETVTIDPFPSELLGLALYDKDDTFAYIPLNGPLSKTSIFKAFKHLENYSWTAHNTKLIYKLLAENQIFLPLAFDTMIASFLVSPNQSKHNLDTLALEHLEVQKTTTESLLGGGKNPKTLDQIPIDLVAALACEEVSITRQLKEIFKNKLEELSLNKVFYDIEMPLIPVIARMEAHGIYIDAPYLSKLGQRLKKQSEELEKTIFQAVGQDFNLNSPKQLGHILFDVLKIKPLKKTQTGFSTSADVLETLQDDNPFIKDILSYRSNEKLRTTYAEALLTQINSITHRIHCSFNQSGAATGRLSSQDPNLQNIPIKTEEGKAIRKAFKPEHAGYSFVALDYSQIELRLLAHMSEDPILIEAFLNHQDIHARTASEVFGVPLAEVTAEMRQRAKAVNFGILYGQQAFGLSQGLNLSMIEAKHFIEKYFITYKRVKEYLESQKELAKQLGYSETLTGRKRPILDIHAKNPMIRAAAERLAINTPLQGTAADLIKMAMITIDKKIYNHKEALGLLLLQIHDELLFEVKDDHIEELSKLAKREMEHVMALKVPLIVDISVGKNWGEC